MKATITKIILLFTTFFLVSACCNEENIYITPEDTEGRVNVYIEGDITNAEAAEQLKNEVGTLTQNIYVQHTTQLTELLISFKNNLTNLLVNNNIKLKNLSIIGGGESYVNTIKILQNNELENITIDNIKTATNFEFVGYNKLQPEKLLCTKLETIYLRLWYSTHKNADNTISFPDLKIIGSHASIIPITSEYSHVTMLTGKCSIVNFPKLEEVYELQFALATLNLTVDSLFINELTFSQLKKVETLKSDVFYTINTLNLPKLEYCKNFFLRGVGNDYISPGTYDNPTINFPILKYCESFTLMFNHSSAEKINNYLHQFLTIQPINSKILYFEQESFPTGQGVLDQQTLINQGNTIEFY